ncbi:unnamed protein product [Ectocarpus sp. CCAP 1310/34]|nr:unnamed protein product [Ectocarpus sp. CCAP 1310/34]
MAAESSGAAAEVTKLALKMGSATVDSITFVADLCEDLPFENQEELQTLYRRCVFLTTCVIVKSRQSSFSEMDVSPVEECLEAAGELVERCGGRGKMTRVLNASSDKDQIARMKANIRDLEANLSLAGVAILEGKTSDLRATVERMAKIQAATQEVILANTEIITDRLSKTPAKPAKIPKSTPIWKSWHVERFDVVERVFEPLTADGGPPLVGLVGDSGSGKTTAASEIVRSNEDRLPSLMLQLAHMVYEEIGGRRPATSDDGTAYIKERMHRGHGGEGLKCLGVVDNVWEKEVVCELLEAGMWVLLSTRDEELVTGWEGEVVEVNELSEVEAESVLRKAAELPPETRLPDDAVDLIELCGRVAMDLAFGGRLSTVRGRSDRTAWSKAASKVRTEMSKGECEGVRGTVVETRDARRKAVVQAGFGDLAIGSDDERVQRLYLSLAVLPDGRRFTVKDAAVLIYDRMPSAEDEASAAGVVEILERWSALCSIRGCYRMAWRGSHYVLHDAHSDFAREKLMDRGDVCRPALVRWTRNISSVDTLRAVRWHEVRDLWLGAEQVGGDGWKITRPYEAALAGLEDSDPHRPTLLDMPVTKVRPYSLSVIRSLHELGLGYKHAGCLEEAEEVLRGCLVIGGTLLGFTHVTVAKTLDLSGCVRAAGQFAQAEELLRRCLATREAKLGPRGLVETEELLARRLEIVEASTALDHEHVADVLFDLGRCMRQAGRMDKAEGLLRRCLKIHEVRWIGACVRDAGRVGDAEELLRHCVEIDEAQLGPEHLQVAGTVLELGGCLRRAGQLMEAEGLLRCSLGIAEAKTDPRGSKVTYTLYRLGRCVQEAGRLGEAEDFLRRCLQIEEARPGPENMEVADTLHWLGVCVRGEGRLEEATELFRQCLEEEQRAKRLSRHDHVTKACTLQELDLCDQEATRVSEAEDLSGTCLTELCSNFRRGMYAEIVFLHCTSFG